VLVQICSAQRVETVEEYKILYDSIVSCLKSVEREADTCIGKPLSDLVKQLDEHGLKIIQTWIHYESNLLYPKDIFGLDLRFMSRGNNDFAHINWLWDPFIAISFDSPKSYEKRYGTVQKIQRGFFGRSRKILFRCGYQNDRILWYGYDV
jgi:hypothetical protein